MIISPARHPTAASRAPRVRGRSDDDATDDRRQTSWCRSPSQRYRTLGARCVASAARADHNPVFVPRRAAGNFGLQAHEPQIADLFGTQSAEAASDQSGPVTGWVDDRARFRIGRVPRTL